MQKMLPKDFPLSSFESFDEPAYQSPESPIHSQQLKNLAKTLPTIVSFHILPSANTTSLDHLPFGKEYDKLLEFNDCIDSPIKAEIPRKIFSDIFKHRLVQPTPILEFRRKKVIKAEDKKFLQLLSAQNYTQDFKDELESQPKFSTARQNEESQLIKKIRKSAILRKVQNFWDHKSLHYPVVFKKLQKSRIGDTTCWFEFHDLTKVQFNEESDGKEIPEDLSFSVAN
jgi:hypothetical protein